MGRICYVKEMLYEEDATCGEVNGNESMVEGLRALGYESSSTEAPDASIPSSGIVRG